MDRGKILIVDDEPNIHLLITKMLGRDYAVVHARNGQEATDIALTELQDLILMDIMMPEMDGYTACSLIESRSKTKDIPRGYAHGHRF
jgi:CheY-like chemotaxis protein